VRKVLADMHVPPAWRRWLTRGGLAAVIAMLLANSDRLWDDDDRVARLHQQIRTAETELRAVERANELARRQALALRRDPAAIEAVARDELGLVYPDELVLRLPPTGAR
jgi:cell division protein FtsB